MNPEALTLYTFEPFDQFLPVDYEQQGDNWLNAVTEALKQKVEGANGYGMGPQQASSAFRYAHIELVMYGIVEATSTPLDIPTLKIIPLTQENNVKALYVVLASKRPITKDDKRVWIESINEALERLGRENPEFEWSAVLGQAHDHTTQTYSLKKKITIHGVSVRSGSRQYAAHKPGMPPSFTGSSLNISWPVIIEGKAKGYDWMGASRQAGIETHKVAALLSLVWNSTWYLLQAPQPMAHGTLKIPAKDIFGHQYRFPHPRVPKIIPKWTQEAWELIDTDAAVSDAVSAYYQGLLLEEEHPSFALVAYIASIETIGKKILGKKCLCCSKETTDKQAFRAGVDKVVGDRRRAKELYAMYDSRSSTAHEGRLHANEDILGHLSFPSMFKQDSKELFVHFDLRKVKNASRILLLKALQNKISLHS